MSSVTRKSLDASNARLQVGNVVAISPKLHPLQKEKHLWTAKIPKMLFL